MADGRHTENHFLLITRLHRVRLRRNLEFGGIIARTRMLGDENVQFRKPTWQTAAILKIIVSPYLSHKLSKLHEFSMQTNFTAGDGNDK